MTWAAVLVQGIQVVVTDPSGASVLQRNLETEVRAHVVRVALVA